MMVRNLFTGAGLAAAAMLFVASSAHAQNFNFSATTTPNPLNSNTAGSFTTFTVGSGAGLTTPTAIVLSNVTTTSAASPNSPASYTNQAFSTVISITDIATAQTVTETLTGVINGTLSSSSAFLQATFDQSALTFTLNNGDFYTLTNFTFLSPSAPGASAAGSLGANTVTFTHPNQTVAPEPGSFALAATGLLGALGMVSVRRRRMAN